MQSGKLTVRLLLSLFGLVLINASMPTQALAVNYKPDSTPETTSAAPQKYEPDALLVKFKASLTDSDVEKSAKRHGALKVKRIKAHNKLPRNRAEQWRKLKFKQGEDLQQAMSRLKKDKDIEAVEPNYVVTINEIPPPERLLPPTGGYFSELWGMDNYGQALGSIVPGGTVVPGGTIDADINAPEAWFLHTGGAASAVVVAVIDTGVDYTHHDLADNIWINPNEVPGDGNGDGCPGVCGADDDGDGLTDEGMDEGLTDDDDENGYVDDFRGWDFVNYDNDPMDDHAHGTHVSGTIAGIGNNDFGVAGVSWHAKIMPLKFLDYRGSGNIDDAVSALNYATQMGAKISNNSWGCSDISCYSQAMYDAIDDAGIQGALFVAAAGNDARNSAGMPANFDLANIISVAATDHYDELAWFSSYNSVTVDLGAPGLDILSSLPDSISLDCPTCPTDYHGDYYGWGSGTSMASPHVAGAAALLKSFKPELTGQQIKDQIIRSVDPLPDLAGKVKSEGRLNIYRMLNNFHFTQSISPKSSLVLRSSTVTYNVTITSNMDVDKTLALSVETPAGSGIDAQIADLQVALPARGSAATTITVTTGSSVPYGAYTLKLYAVEQDSGGITDTAKFGLTVTPRVDLKMSDVSTMASFLPVNGEATVSTTVENIGVDATTVKTMVGIYLSQDEFITTEDTLIGSRIISSLASGATSTLGTTVKIPAQFTPGSYHLGAIADVKNAQLEIDRSNNVKTTGTTIDVVREVDLVMTNVGTSATSLPIGGTITVNAAIQNQGRTPTTITGATLEGSQIGIYLSTDAAITAGDMQIGVLYTPTQSNKLDPGESYPFSRTVTIPSTLLPGTDYYLGVIADVNNVQPEINQSNNAEDNNALAGNVALTTVRDVDLEITAVTTSAVDLPINGLITVNAGIVNNGSTPTTATFPNYIKIGIYLSSDETITTSDDVWLGDTVLSSLAAGRSVTKSKSVTIPSNLVPGTKYYLGVIVDYQNSQPETNESNNARATTTSYQVVTNVDLVVTDVSTSVSPLPVGGYARISTTVMNTGATPTTTSTKVKIYLSTDSTITTDDHPVGDLSTIKGLAGQKSYTSSGTLPIPSDLAGTYYLGAIADAGSQQTETNENNNALAGATVVVAPGVDLVIFNMYTPYTQGWPYIVIGQDFTINTTVVNRGTPGVASGANEIKFYLSTDATVSADDIPLGSQALGSLAGGASVSNATTVRAPTTVAPGNYSILAIVDASNTQLETDESNNTGGGGAFGFIANVDLVMAAVSTTAPGVAVGKSFVINATEKNQGPDAMISGTTIRFYLSPDATVDPGDQLLYGERYVAPLAAWQEKATSTSVIIPTFVLPGTYYIGAMADGHLELVETDENNNLLAGGTITVVSKDVDLVMTAVSTAASSVPTGGDFTIDNTEKNLGTDAMTAASNTLNFYLSTDTIISSADDIPLTGTQAVAQLAAGASMANSTMVTVPITVTPGTYYIGAIADADNGQVETNETNNWLAGSQTLTVLNQLPTADAGPAQAVNEGAVTTLTGSGTDSDGTIVSYLWTQTGGPTVALSGASTATATFTAPQVSVDTVLTFQLTVTDDDSGTGSATTTVTVRNVNQLPTANPGLPQNGNEGTAATLTGSGTDPDGTIVSYTWTQTGGPAVTLAGANTATATFTAPQVSVDTVLTFQLTVTDNDGGTGSATTTVTVKNDNINPTAPSDLIATAVSNSQINLAWTASTDNVGVVGYKIERCTGSKCTNFAQIATSTTNSFSNTGLAARTAYKYRVSAYDAAGNHSGYSIPPASATTLR